MFNTIFLKEVRDHLLTFRFSAALITTFILIVISVWVLGDDYLRRLNAYNRASDLYAQEAREVYVPSRIIPQVHRSPSPPSIFAQGETRHLGNSVTIRRWTIPSRATDNFTDNELLAAYPSFDLLTVFTLVISIFGLLLTYDSLSGERENGTLKQMYCNSVSRSTIFAAKFLAGVMVIAIPFLISFLSALIILQFIHGISFTGQMWLSVFVMLTIGLVFGAIFIAIGLLSSSIFRRSSISLVFSLLLWALGVLIIPIAANAVSTTVVELSPQWEIDDFAKETRREIRQNRPDFGVDRVSIWGSIGGQYQSLFDSNPSGFLWVEKFINYTEPAYYRRAEQIRNLENQHMQKKKQQSQLSFWLSLPAPATHLRTAFTTLASTDYSTHMRFMEHARRFRSQMIDIFRSKNYLTTNTSEFVSRRTPEERTQAGWEQRLAKYREMQTSGQKIGWDTEFEPLPPDTIPPFSFNSFEPDFLSALEPITALIITLIIIFLVGYVAFLRYDVR